MMVKIGNKISALIAAAVMLLQALPLCAAEAQNTADLNSEISDYSADSSSSQLTFPNYLKTVENIYPVGSYAAENQNAELNQGNSFTTRVVAENAGLYALKLTYKVVRSKGQYPAVAIAVNGEIPYREAASVNLMRRWENAEKSDELLTNDIIPEQREVFEPQTVYLRDNSEYYGDILYFYLQKGENSAEIRMLAESIEISGVVFENYEKPQSYKAAKDGLRGESYSGAPVIIEGENAVYKSDASLYAVNDASSAGVSPSSPYKKYLNAIGSSSWSNMSQYLEWELEIPQDGLYQIAVKYRQSTKIGMNSYRRITIDGKAPYSELEAAEFSYSPSYKNLLLSDESGEPMAFYLSKGTHTLRMEVVIGRLGTVLPYLEESVKALNGIYRSVIMVTGSNPDTLRDYRLEEVIPDTIKQLDIQRAELDGLFEKISEITGGSSGTKIIGTVKKQLAEFVDDPYNMTSSLADFKSNISSLGSWLTEAKSQPLSIDYITVSGVGQKLSPAKPGLLKSLKYSLQSFFYTFSDEYRNHSGNNDVITVWISSGAAQHAVVNQLTRAAYNKNAQDRIEVKLVTTSLISAIIADKAPDICLGAAPDAVMNYAYRDALVDLSGFGDYEEVSRRFRESAAVPVSYGSSVYALPLTQTYSMLFYRRDVLADMSVKVPETWDEVISAMAALKKKNLEFGVPSDIHSFLTLLFQKGGTLYNSELSACTITDYNSIDAFTTFSSWFTEYKSPIAFNGQQRFRTGEMPLMIADYSMYNTLNVLAPEIRGLWGIAMIPGSYKGDTLDRSVAGTGTYAIILNEKKKDGAWEFLKWWTSADTQAKYAERLEMALGQSGRYNTANLQAFDTLGYPLEVSEIIKRQGEFAVGVPNAPGGYYVSRYLTNALNKVLYQGEIPGNALHSFAKTIDDEITYKREEFGLNNR